MAVPVGLSDTMAAVALAVAAYAGLRLAVAGPWRRRLHYDINLSHALMGTAMAGMIVSCLNVLPTRAWEAVFAAEAVWFALATALFVRVLGWSGKDDDRVHHASHYATHTVMALSMLYMYLEGGAQPTGHPNMAMPGAPGNAVSGAAGDATLLSLLFVVFLLVSAICEVDSVHPFARLAAVPANGTPAAALTRVAAGSSSGPARGGSAHGLFMLGATGVSAPRATGLWLAPRLESVSHVAMCVVMAYMLVIMW